MQDHCCNVPVEPPAIILGSLGHDVGALKITVALEELRRLNTSR